MRRLVTELLLGAFCLGTLAISAHGQAPALPAQNNLVAAPTPSATPRIVQNFAPVTDEVMRAPRPEDWLMLGTHDTPPVYTVATQWLRDGSAQLRAAYLAERLIRDPSERAVRDPSCASVAQPSPPSANAGALAARRKRRAAEGPRRGRRSIHHD